MGWKSAKLVCNSETNHYFYDIVVMPIKKFLTYFVLLSLLILSFLFFYKNQDSSEKKETQKHNKKQQKKIPRQRYKNIVGDTTILLSKIEISIKSSVNCKYDLLVLPGWNFNKNLWCDSSALCELAKNKGYRLIMPEMGKSIYASQYFPETRKDWNKYPTLTWLCDTLLPYLKKEYGIFSTKNNFIIGNSTGARGAVLLAIKTDTIFLAGAAFSGDFDQTKMPKDPLIKGVYGSYEKFKTRWQSIDNPTEQMKRLKTRFYFAHGIKDKIVPFSQTKTFFDTLQQYKPIHKFNSPEAGHNFIFWNNVLESTFLFFQQHLNK